ncbi:hypothetical protein HanIR_Chr09g0420001 [Helianthus annuus]|nr:hypothetical protein HanIR_Chr09g0420001 [Helianthus annuus]
MVVVVSEYKGGLRLPVFERVAMGCDGAGCEVCGGGQGVGMPVFWVGMDCEGCWADGWACWADGWARGAGWDGWAGWAVGSWAGLGLWLQVNGKEEVVVGLVEGGGGVELGREKVKPGGGVSSKNWYKFGVVGMVEGKTVSTKVTCRDIVTLLVVGSKHLYP